MRALDIAASGMAAQDLNVQVISNNIANMNTVGFKKQRAEFQDLLYQTVEQAGAQSSDQGTIVPTGVRVVQGSIEQSNVSAVSEMSRMIEITRAYEQISILLQQENTERTTALDKLSAVPA